MTATSEIDFDALPKITPFDRLPEAREAQRRLDALGERRKAIQARAREITDELTGLLTGTAATALLEGRAGPVRVGDLRAERAGLESELQQVERAEVIGRDQLERLRAMIRPAWCDAADAWHRELIEEKARHARELVRLQRREESLMAEIAHAGYGVEGAAGFHGKACLVGRADLADLAGVEAWLHQERQAGRAADDE